MNPSLFLITFLCFLITPSFTYLTFNETEPNFEIRRSLNFKTEIVINLVKQIDPSGNTTLCNEPGVYLRWVHEDGTIEANMVDFPTTISELNFCPAPDGEYPLDVYRILPDSILIIYVNSANTSFYGLIVDKSGKPIKNSYIAPLSVINDELYPNFNLMPYPNTNQETNFIFTSYDSETSVVWRNLMIDDEKNIQEISNGTIYLNGPFDKYFISPELNENFAFVNISTTQYQFNSPTKRTLEASISYVDTIANKTTGPFILYSSTTPNLDILKVLCNTRSSDYYFCVMFMTENNVRKYISQTSFLYPSIIISNKEFFDIESYDLENSEYTFLGFNQLIFGDILLEIIINDKLTGAKIDNDGNFKSFWANNLTVSDNFSIVEFQNGTANLIVKEGDFTFKIVTSIIEDPIIYDYGIPEILTSYPTINSEIPTSTTVINITYDVPVMFSNERNISIYQNVSGMPLLRQSIPGDNKFVKITYSDDERTISFDILSSSFNQNNADYFVMIDDGAVKNRNNGQPLLGIEKGFWKFRTGSSESKLADDATGMFSLTHEGSMFFGFLQTKDQLEFLEILRKDLATILSVDVSRLENIQPYNIQYDQTVLTITFHLPIKAAANEYERSVLDLVNDLNLLILNKNITMVSWINTTNTIRSDLGFKFHRNIFVVHGFKLIVAGACGVPLVFLFAWAQWTYPSGQNFALFKLVLIIMDAVFDILFIVQNSSKVERLLWPSIVFTALPMAVNVGFGSVILLFEMGSNARFRNHMMRYPDIASFFTVLAITDICALNILSSRFGGMKCFRAPVSKRTLKYISWLAWVGIFLEDIPQLVIQAVYERSVTEYDFVPFFSLGISGMSLAIDISNKIFECFGPTYGFTIVNNEDEDEDEEDDGSDIRLIVTDNENNRTFITISKEGKSDLADELAKKFSTAIEASESKTLRRLGSSGSASGSAPPPASASASASGSAPPSRSTSIRTRTSTSSGSESVLRVRTP